MKEYPNISHPKKNKSRLGGLGDLYFCMSEKEYSSLLDLKPLYEAEIDEYKKHEIEDQCFEAGLKTILFSALCVEASINDYAAWQLGDNYFEKHLANMDVISKWVVIPKLVCGQSINKSGAAFSHLKKLIKARNSLVHNKSKEFSMSAPDLGQKLENRHLNFYENANNAFKALLLLSLEFDMVVGLGYNPLRCLDRNISPMLDVAENLNAIYSDCKNIVARNVNAS